MCWGLTALCPVAWPDRRAAFCTPPLRTKPYSQADSEKDALKKKKSFQIKHSLAASTVSKQTVVLNGRVQDEGQLKAPSRVLLATSSHATLCAQHHAYTHPHPNAYTQRHPVCSSGPLSLPGKAAAALTREPPGWKLTLEKPRGMRTKRNPSIASLAFVSKFPH